MGSKAQGHSDNVEFYLQVKKVPSSSRVLENGFLQRSALLPVPWRRRTDVCIVYPRQGQTHTLQIPIFSLIND